MCLHLHVYICQCTCHVCVRLSACVLWNVQRGLSLFVCQSSCQDHQRAKPRREECEKRWRGGRMRTRENERQQGSCRERIKELFQALHVMFSPALLQMTMNTIYTYGMRRSPYNDREKKPNSWSISQLWDTHPHLKRDKGLCEGTRIHYFINNETQTHKDTDANTEIPARQESNILFRDSWIHTNAVMSSSSFAYTQAGSPMCIHPTQTLTG